MATSLAALEAAVPRYRARLTTLADVRIQLRAAALRIEQAYGAAVRRRWEPVSDAEALALPPNQLHLRRHPLLPTSILIPQPTCGQMQRDQFKASKWLKASVLVEQLWGGAGGSCYWQMTFHSAGPRFCRRHADASSRRS